MNIIKEKSIKHLFFFSSCLFWLIPGHPSFLDSYSSLIHPVNFMVVVLLWAISYRLIWNRSNFTLFIIAIILFATSTGISYLASTNTSLYGLSAKYYSNNKFSLPIEHSWKYSENKLFTRIDKNINFSPVGFSFFKTSFPLYFSNNWNTRVWSKDLSEDTSEYIFSAEWEAKITIPENVSKIKLHSNGGLSKLILDGKVVENEYKLKGQVSEYTVYPIQITFVRNSIEPPSLNLYWVRDGQKETIPSWAFTPKHSKQLLEPYNKYTQYSVIIIWIAALILFYLSVNIRFKFNYNWFLWTFFFCSSVISALYLEKKSIEFGFPIFERGNDWLLYETLARAILHGNIWGDNSLITMNFGYRYLLSGAHLLMGESIVAVIWLQQILIFGLITAVMSLLKHLYNIRVALLVGFFILSSYQFVKFSFVLLDTIYGIGFSAIAIYFLLHYSKDKKTKYIIYSAIFMGIAILIRANFLPFILFVCIWILFINKQSIKDKSRDAILFFLISCIFSSLLGIRNQLVTEQWVFLPQTGLSNLWIGNHPKKYDGPTYFTTKQLPKDQILSEVSNYVINEPKETMKRIFTKISYITGVKIYPLGGYAKHKEGIKIKPKILIPWILAIWGAIYLWINQMYRNELSLLILWIGIVNIPLIVIFPWGYGWRLSGPSFLAVYLIGALAVDYLITKHKQKNAS